MNTLAVPAERSTLAVPAETFAALVEALRIQMDSNGHFIWCSEQQTRWGVQCSGKCLIARQALEKAEQVIA